MRITRTSGLVLITLCVFSPAIWAQPPRKPLRESVTLDVDSTVVKRLRTVEDHLAEQQWGQAIDILQQLADESGQKLAPVEPGRYVNVSTYCNLLLATMPAEGLAAYRQKVDPQARAWLEGWRTSGDERLLVRLITKAFASSYGDDALWALGENAWGRGDLASARGSWEQMLPPPKDFPIGDPLPALRYPDADRTPAEIRARLILCSIMERNTERAQTELEQFRARHADAEGHLAGRDGNFAAILTDVLAKSAEWTTDTEEHVATFAINVRRNGVLPHAVDVGAPLWEAPLRPSLLPPLTQQSALPSQGPLSYSPVVFGDVVLVSDPDAIFAWNLYTGKPAWPTRDRESAAIYHLTALPDERSLPPDRPTVGVPRQTMALHEGRLYARMGSPVTSAARHELRDVITRIVCLDLAHGEGKLLWDLAGHDIETDGPEWAFEGSPVVAHGRAYVALTRRRPQFQIGVACLDADTGAVQWVRETASGLLPVDEDQNWVSHRLLTFAGNTLFESTDMGAVLALDARDGNTRWAVTYESKPADTAAKLSDPMSQGLLPPLFHEGTLIVAPNDSDQILALDAQSGRLRWQRAVGDRIRHLLGVAEGRLIAGGKSLWALDVRTGETGWKLGFSDPEGFGYGRGILAGDLVYWPTREELFLVEQKTGAIQRRIPLNTPLYSVTGGNLAIDDGVLLIAEPTRLVAFCEYSLLKKRLREQISANPTDAELYFRLAEVETATREFDAATEHYRQAITLAQRPDSTAGKALRESASRQLYALLMQRGQQAASEQDVAGAQRYFEAAVNAAPEANRQVAALMQVADSHLVRDDPAAALSVYQRILGEPKLRAVDLGEQSAELSARQKIAQLVRRYGREIYARQETAAEEQLTRALAAGDRDTIRRVLEQYPESVAASAALLKLARLDRSRHAVLPAMQTYRQFLSRASSTDERRAALREYAELAESQGCWRPAREAWQRLAAEFPDAKLAVDSVEQSVTQFVTERLARRDYQRLRQLDAPSAILPLQQTWTRSLSRADHVLLPKGTAPSVDLQCVLVSGERLQCLDRATGRRRWQSADALQPAWAAYVGPALILANERQVRAVSLPSGEMLWQRSLETQAAAEPSATRAVQFSCAGDAVIAFDPRRGVTAIQSTDGSLMWEYRTRLGRLQPSWHCDNRQIVLQTLQPNRVVILETETGQVRAQRPGPEDAWPRPPVALADDQFAVVTAERRLLAFSPLEKHGWSETQPVAHAHREPELIARGSRLFLVVDGDTLRELDPQSGRKRWSGGLALQPLEQASRQLCLDDEHAYAAAMGVLRCVSLRDGQRRWERSLDATLEQWCVTRAGRFLAVFPLRDDNGTFPLIFCDASTGLPVQRLNLTARATDPTLQPQDETSLLVTDDRLSAFAPMRAAFAQADQSVE